MVYRHSFWKEVLLRLGYRTPLFHAAHKQLKLIKFSMSLAFSNDFPYYQSNYNNNRIIKQRISGMENSYIQLSRPYHKACTRKNTQSICRSWQFNGGAEVLRAKLGHCSPSHYLTCRKHSWRTTKRHIGLLQQCKRSADWPKTSAVQ